VCLKHLYFIARREGMGGVRGKPERERKKEGENLCTCDCVCVRERVCVYVCTRVFGHSSAVAGF